MEIIADTISEAWEKSIYNLINNTAPLVFTQRGERAKELIGVQMTIAKPLSNPIISKIYPFGDLFIEDYCANILNASSGGNHSISSRIVKSKKLVEKSNNQIIKVVNLLRKEPDTRRAIICLWDAENDIHTQHPPCACTIQFLLRDNKLDTIAYFRSNDSWMAALPDMIAITRLSNIVVEKLNVNIGKYHHFAASYHLYEPDIVPAIFALEGVVL